MSKDSKKQEPFNPLDKKNIAESIALKFISQPLVDFTTARFKGEGVYAIYYYGTFPLYSKIVHYNRLGNGEWPVYVGSADTAKGRIGAAPNEGSSAIYNRLMNHHKSISEVDNLDLSDFKIRYLKVDSIFIPLGESLMIRHFEPVWNTRISGFGSKTPGKGRSGQQKSQWDTIHPGRSYTIKLNLPDNESIRKDDGYLVGVQKFIDLKYNDLIK